MTTKDPFVLRATKRQARLQKLRGPARGEVVGEFFLLLDITAADAPVYIPLSIASGKKTTGFVYQIEGTAVGEIDTTDLSVKGQGVTQITLGTIRYVKIPAGKTATFRILITIRGKTGKKYGIAITRINWKRDPSEARYQKWEGEVRVEGK